MQIFGDTKPGGSDRRQRCEIGLGIWGDNMTGYMESYAWGHGEIDRAYIFETATLWFGVLQVGLSYWLVPCMFHLWRLSGAWSERSDLEVGVLVFSFIIL